MLYRRNLPNNLQMRWLRKSQPIVLKVTEKFQLKVGGDDPNTDIERIHVVSELMEPSDVLIADANTGWLMHQATRVVRGVSGVDVYIEQPCLSYEECLSIRERTDHPFVLDETVDSINMLLRGHADRAMDIVNIKISKFGGLTKAKLTRDLCVELGIAMTIEDSWGGDVTTAAIAHLAHSTPTEFLFTATDFNSYVTVSTAEGAPATGQWQNGSLYTTWVGNYPGYGRVRQSSCSYRIIFLFSLTNHLSKYGTLFTM